MKDYIIEIDGVEFSYEETEDREDLALKGVDIKIEKGEFVVILGHNGSGKSTLAKLINGQHFPTKGDITIKGMNTKDDTKIWDIRSTCGMVFQNPDNQIITTVVEEEVAFGPENLGVPQEELRSRVDKCLEIVGMTEYKKHSPALLSGGQKQRIAIAGILAMNPECIVLDEPTAMLDPSGRKDIMDTIKFLNREHNKTIIHITHYMEEAISADRIIVMNSGEVVMEGSPREIFVQVDKMKALGLDVPQVTELAYLLNKDGFDVSKDVLSIDDMVKAI